MGRQRLQRRKALHLRKRPVRPTGAAAATAGASVSASTAAARAARHSATALPSDVVPDSLRSMRCLQ